jgi:hypothetical protein
MRNGALGSVVLGARSNRKELYIPPVSIPFTAASEIVLSTTFAASLTTSTGLLRAMGEVENRRAWRANAVRNMVAVCVVERFGELCLLIDCLVGV